MISMILLDLFFNQNQPLKSADDQYVRILTNKIKTWEVLQKLKKKNKKIGPCDLN
jgi:hypothetical protein